MPAISKIRSGTRPSVVAVSLLALSVGCGTSSGNGGVSVAGAANVGLGGGPAAGGGSGAAGGRVGGAGGTSGVAGRGGAGSSGASSSGVAGSGGVVGGSGALGASGASSGQGGSAGLGAGGSGGAPAQGGTAGTGGSAGAGTGGSAGMPAVLAATPPMGWNSWNTFQCNLNETLIKGIADTFVSSGMLAAGYQYVNLDDCWMDGRDSSGKLRWNTTKFPSGIPALADYVHGKGMKLGIYETPNTSTCVGLYGGISKTVAVGSLGHETSDAQTFASWGIDYLKYDKCQGPITAFTTMRDALRATGRPIFYSINPGDGSGCPPNSCSINLPTIANMWRIGFDISGNWASMTGLIDQDANLYSYAGPGHWNDPDMMEVGNGLTDTEGRSHFSMWAMLAAPLIAGNDLRSMSAATKATLTNTEVIAVDQDPLGAQGRLVASPGSNLQVWSKTLSGTNTRAVALLNRSGSAASITVQWTALGIPAGAATVRDLWAHSDLGASSGSYTAQAVPSHGVVMLKVTSTP
jgi:alpha-galactosidase